MKTHISTTSLFNKFHIILVLFSFVFSSALYASDCNSPDGTVSPGSVINDTLTYATNQSDYYTMTPTTDSEITFSVTFEKKVRMILRKNGSWVTSVTSTSNGDTISITQNVTSGDVYCIELEMQYPTWTTTLNAYNYTFTVTGSNNPPIANDKSFSILKNSTLNQNLLTDGGIADSDPDGDTLTVSKLTDPIHGTVNVNSDGSFTYTPNTDYVGTDYFTYEINDGNGATDSATVNIEITSNNPIANDKNFFTPINTALNANVITDGGIADSDPNGDAISISNHTEPTYGSLTINSDGSFTYIPNTNYIGTDSFTYTLSDGTLTDNATVSIQIYNVGDEPIPTGNADATTAICASFEDVLQTRNNPSKIEHYTGATAYIYDNPDCTLNTGEVDFGMWQHLYCDSGGDATASGIYGNSFSISYNNPPENASISDIPSSSTDDITISTDTTLNNTQYNKVEVGTGSIGNLEVNFSALQKINTLNFTTNNSVVFSSPTTYNLEIGSIGIVNNGSGNSLSTSTVPKNIKIDTFSLPEGTTVNFEAQQTIKAETFEIGRGGTDITLKAQYIQINNLHQTNSGSGTSNIEIIADYVDIGTLDLDQEATITFKPYTPGKRVLFRSNSISASSSSTMIVSSGNYYTSSFDIPGSSDVSSIRALDSSQLINFFINGDFKPGNNPGINSDGNDGNFGTLPPSNFLLFINGDLETGGGGTTFNATVYVEGSSNLGSPTYIKGALSSNYDIDIGNSSKFYYSQDINDSGWGECTNSDTYTFQNNYSCGIMPTVLTSYKSITTQQNDVYNTCTISVKDYSLTEDAHQPIVCYQDTTSGTLCSCDPSVSECSSNNTCTIVPEPKNRLDYTVYETPLTDTNTINGDMTFTDIAYGSYTFTQHGANINFEPTETYSDKDTKLMLLGDFDFADNDQTITFDGGDYYFNSFKIDRDTTNGNINQINICAKDDIRIFIKNDFVYSGNHINDESCGGKIFIYVEGDAQIDANGGGSSTVPIFIYTKGDVSIENSGDSNDWYGAITAEGDIDITGMNINFIYDDSAENFGYGECQMCYSDIIVGGMSMNMMGCAGFSFMSDIKVPIFSTDTLNNVTVDEVHDETDFSFSFMSTNNVLDENGTVVADATTVSSGWDNTAPGMDVTLFGGKAITYPLGISYGPADENSGYYQLHSSSLFSMSFDPCDWKNSLNYVAHYEDSTGRHYDTLLSPCSIPISPPTPLFLTGPFDAWDTNRSITDRNISTKIVSQDFNLTIASIDETNSATEIKEGIDMQYQLYDTIQNTALTSWSDYNASLASDGEEEIKLFRNINSAHKSVKVRFKFCAYDSGSGLILKSLSYCDATSSDYNSSYDLNTSTFSSDAFAIRPYGFKVFGENQYKRSAEDFNITIKATNESNYTITTSGLNLNSIQSVSDYNASLSNINITSHFYTPTPAELLQMQTDTSKTDVSTCPNTGVFTINNPTSNFVNGEVNASLKFSETGILDINISEKPGFEWAVIDADDTSDTQRYIKPSTITYDKSDISKQTLLLFVPYKFETSSQYLTTTSQNWVYMNDINGSNSTFTTPNMSAYIKYTIVAKNKDGAITTNYTKTCFPDVDEIYCPRVNGLKLNTTFDLFLDATLNSTSNVNINLYSEDNSSTAIWTPNKNLSLSSGDNSIQEWISPFQFENGQAEAKVYFNIDRNTSNAINPVIIKVKDTNTSTSWMSNPGSPEEFLSLSPEDNKTFYYGRVHAPDQRFMNISDNAKVYYEIYSNLSQTQRESFGITGKESTDSINWYINTLHNSLGEGNVTLYTSNSGVTFGTPPATTSNSTTNPTNGVESITLTAPSLPHKDKIVMTPSSWLIYNKFNSSATTTDFLVEFYSNNEKWAGVGDLGKTVDTNVSKKQNRRLDW